MVTTISPISDKRWDDFVIKHPASTIFHHSVWARVLRDRYQYEPMYYVVEDDRSNITAAAPIFPIRTRLIGNKLLCLPCSEYCYPLANSSESLVPLMTVLKAEVDSSKASFIEFRGWNGLATPDELGLTEYPRYLRHVTVLDEDTEKLRAELDRQHYHLKRNLKKAEKSGISIREADTEDDLRCFHRLSVQTRRRIHRLPWPYDFFKSIYKHVVAPGHGFLLLAELDGKTIAGSLYFCFKDTVLLKINASNKDYSQYRGNYLVTWKAMERACWEGYRYFDFGISDPDNTGLIAFKKQWGSEEMELSYYYYPITRRFKLLQEGNPNYMRAYIAVNRFLPGFVAKLASNTFYRYLG